MDMNAHCMTVGGVFFLLLKIYFFRVGPHDAVIAADSPASRMGREKKIHKFVVRKLPFRSWTKYCKQDTRIA